MQAALCSPIALHRPCCVHRRPLTCLTRTRSADVIRVRSHAEQVYKVESQLIQAGFSQKQARTLLLTGSRLSEIRRKADFQQIKSVFEAAWEIEDEFMQHGMDLKGARQVGCMFVALAATQLKGRGLAVGYHSEEFWNFWEVSAAEGTGQCLEAAGVPRYSGYSLAKSILNFFILDQKNDQKK